MKMGEERVKSSSPASGLINNTRLLDVKAVVRANNVWLAQRICMKTLHIGQEDRNIGLSNTGNFMRHDKEQIKSSNS